jgi:exopolysaccharide biosynthesis WecB/TagA/CpsF family protein
MHPTPLGEGTPVMATWRGRVPLGALLALPTMRRADPGWLLCQSALIAPGLFHGAINNSPDCAPRYAVYARTAVRRNFGTAFGMNDMTNVLMIDDYELAEACAIVTAFGSERFGYVVTPNVDHVIRHFHDPEFRALYAQAAYVFLDSHFLAHLIGFFKRQRHRVSPGSDLTAAVMSSAIKPNDVAVMVGGSVEQAQDLRARFGLKALRHIDPPMNFIHDKVAVESCLRAIEESSPFRFCFLAIGSPQQEIIAQKLKGRGVARGLALCIGASINFITGVEKRAPLWIRKSGFEWLFRLVQNPKRLAKRYLVRGPRIFLLLPHIELRLRRPIAVPREVLTMSGTPLMTAVTGSQV